MMRMDVQVPCSIKRVPSPCREKALSGTTHVCFVLVRLILRWPSQETLQGDDRGKSYHVRCMHAWCGLCLPYILPIF